MKKHFTKLIVALLALAMLLPIVVQAAPTDGWTDEAEQAYQITRERFAAGAVIGKMAEVLQDFAARLPERE